MTNYVYIVIQFIYIYLLGNIKLFFPKEAFDGNNDNKINAK